MAKWFLRIQKLKKLYRLIDTVNDKKKKWKKFCERIQSCPIKLSTNSYSYPLYNSFYDITGKKDTP